MDILIKGLEMPKNGCKDCRFHNYSIIPSENKYLHLCYVQCLAEKTETKEVVKLHDDCPLIPVPEHGDLIDRDDLVARFQHLTSHPTGYEVVSKIFDAEVVLERTT